MKRILVLALALILAVSSLAVPSYAAEPMDQVDLMTAIGYDFYRNGELWSNSISPSVWANYCTSAKLSWEFISPLRFEKIVFTLEAERVPDRVVFDRGGWFYNATLLGSVGSIYQYEVDFSGIHDASFRSVAGVDIQYDAYYSGVFNLISCVGYVKNYVSFDTVDYFANAIMFDNGEGGIVQPDDFDFRWPVSIASETGASLPVIVDFDGPTGSDFYTVDYGEVFLKVPFDSSFAYLDSVSFLIYSCGEISELGARLENGDGSIINGLPLTYEFCGETQYLFELEEQFVRILCYVVTVDVSGFSLSDFYLTLQTNIDSVFGSWIYQYDRGFYFWCSSIVGYYESFETPWYSIFGRWLNTQLGIYNAAIQSSLSSIESYFSTLINDTIYWFRISMEKLWDTLINDTLKWFRSSMEQWLGKIFDVLNASGDNQDFQDDVADQGDKLDDMAGVMDSVTQPALDSINTDLSGIVSAQDTANIANVYTMVIGDSFMPQIMTMVVVMAMMSFALFGKR